MARTDQFGSNPFAAPEMDLSTPAEQRTSGRFIDANFWQRFVAFIVDSIICWLIAIILAFAVGISIGVILTISGDDLERSQPMLNRLGYLIGVVVWWLYFALQESSQLGATLGKRAMSLKVIGLSGESISFWRATGRYFGKYVSVLVLIGYLIQPFTENKQALHDLMAGTLVIRD